MAYQHEDAGDAVEQLRHDWMNSVNNNVLFEGLSGPHIVLPSEEETNGVIGKTVQIQHEQMGTPIISMHLKFDTNDKSLYLDRVMVDEAIVKKDHNLVLGCMKRILSNLVDYAGHELRASRLVVGRDDGERTFCKTYIANRAGLKPPEEQSQRAQAQLLDRLEYLASDETRIGTLGDIENDKIKVRYGDRLAEASGVTRPLSYDDLFEISNNEIAHMILQGDIVPVDDNTVLMPLAPSHKTSASLKADAKTLLEVLEYESSKGKHVNIFSLVKNTAISEDLHSHIESDMELDLTNETAVKFAKGYLKGNAQEREAVRQAVTQAQGISR